MKDLSQQEYKDLMEYIKEKTGAKSVLLMYADQPVPNAQMAVGVVPVEVRVQTIGIAPTHIKVFNDMVMGPYSQGMVKVAKHEPPPPGSVPLSLDDLK